MIFPDHDRMLEQIPEHLLTSGYSTPLAAVSEAARLMVLHYFDEGDLARRRYALISVVPALRGREIASVARYQRLFREFIADRTGASAEPAQLRAELAAAAVVAAHNYVLRRWLRAESADPIAELDEAIRMITDLFTTLAAPETGNDPSGDGQGTIIVAFRAGQDLDALLPAIRRLTEAPDDGS